jgi:hypothetical protein
LPAPDALTLEGDAPAFWAEAKLDSVTVNLRGGTADAQLFTRSGYLKRQLKFSDSADGVNHYAWQNTADKAEASLPVNPRVRLNKYRRIIDNAQAKLSVNPRTREYFYSETGMQGDQPYTVKAHGWLKSSQSGSQQAAR